MRIVSGTSHGWVRIGRDSGSGCWRTTEVLLGKQGAPGQIVPLFTPDLLLLQREGRVTHERTSCRHDADCYVERPPGILERVLRQRVFAVDLVRHRPVRVGRALVGALAFDALQLPGAAREGPGARAAHGLSVLRLARALVLGDPG